MERKPIEKWIAQGRKNCKSYVFYEDKVLDLTDFILLHPGGLKAIKNYVYKDITNIIFEVYHHQRGPTLAKLMTYLVGHIPQSEATNQRQKVERLAHSDRPKSKKKVCFFEDEDKHNRGYVSRSNNDDAKKSMKKTVGRDKENIRESTHKSKPAESVSKSKSKSRDKKKEFLTSIKVIKSEERKTYDDYYQENQQKIREKQRANTQKKKSRKDKPSPGAYSFEHNELDEEKPNFRVPILLVKSMNRNR